jgi:hypothetical protein
MLHQSCAGSTLRSENTIEKDFGLQIGCLSIQTTMLARLSGESRIRRECAARRGGGRATRALASTVKKDGTRLIRAGQLPGRGSRYGV